MRENGVETIPARMLNEFAYCPRLFWYEHVEGLFRESADTVDGSIKHTRHDKPSTRAAPATSRDRRLAEASSEDGAVERTTALQLGSERLGLVAKLDVVEDGPDGCVPIEFKRGKAPDPESRSRSAIDVADWGALPPAEAPPSNDATLERDAPLDRVEAWTRAWEADLVQLGAQVLLLEDNGRKVPYAVLSYLGNRKRVRVPVGDKLRELALGALRDARALLTRGVIPPPLVDDRRCERCSLARRETPLRRPFRRSSGGRFGLDGARVRAGVRGRSNWPTSSWFLRRGTYSARGTRDRRTAVERAESAM
jgi:CRISP-associated protein Cas1